MSLSDSSSARCTKRAGFVIPGNRSRSPHIWAAGTAVVGRPETFRHLVGVESEARAPARSHAPSAQLLGVVVDPASADPPPARYLLGGDALGPRGRLGGGSGDQLGDPLGDRLNRLGGDAQLPGSDDFRVRHRRLLLPKGPRRTLGCSVPSGAQWAIRASAISI